MRKYHVIWAVLLVAVGTAAEGQAAPSSRFDETTHTCRYLNDGPLEWESRPWGQGGRLFRERCKTCHTRGNDKGAPFLWAESKTSRGWNRVFTEKYPACAKDGSWGEMTMEQQMELNDYLYRWASDAHNANFDSC